MGSPPSIDDLAREFFDVHHARPAPSHDASRHTSSGAHLRHDLGSRGLPQAHASGGAGQAWQTSVMARARRPASRRGGGQGGDSSDKDVSSGERRDAQRPAVLDMLRTLPAPKPAEQVKAIAPAWLDEARQEQPKPTAAPSTRSSVDSAPSDAVDKDRAHQAGALRVETPTDHHRRGKLGNLVNFFASTPTREKPSSGSFEVAGSSKSASPLTAYTVGVPKKKQRRTSVFSLPINIPNPFSRSAPAPAVSEQPSPPARPPPSPPPQPPAAPAEDAAPPAAPTTSAAADPGAEQQDPQAAKVSVSRMKAHLQIGRLANNWRLRASDQAFPALAPFVPKLLKEDILAMAPRFREPNKAEGALESNGVRDLYAIRKELTPSMARFQGAIMVADVTGFTKLTELLSSQGHGGVELLTKCMNNVFCQVIDMVHSYSGDVMKFAGDAMIIAFYPNAEEIAQPDGGLHAAVSRCAHCACELARSLGHMRMLANGDVQPISHKDFVAMQQQEADKTERDFKAAKAAALLQEGAADASGHVRSDHTFSWLGAPYQSRRTRDVSTKSSASTAVSRRSLDEASALGVQRPPSLTQRLATFGRELFQSDAGPSAATSRAGIDESADSADPPSATLLPSRSKSLVFPKNPFTSRAAKSRTTSTLVVGKSKSQANMLFTHDSNESSLPAQAPSQRSNELPPDIKSIHINNLFARHSNMLLPVDAQRPSRARTLDTNDLPDASLLPPGNGCSGAIEIDYAAAARSSGDSVRDAPSAYASRHGVAEALERAPAPSASGGGQRGPPDSGLEYDWTDRRERSTRLRPGTSRGGDSPCVWPDDAFAAPTASGLSSASVGDPCVSRREARRAASGRDWSLQVGTSSISQPEPQMAGWQRRVAGRGVAPKRAPARSRARADVVWSGRGSRGCRGGGICRGDAGVWVPGAASVGGVPAPAAAAAEGVEGDADDAAAKSPGLLQRLQVKMALLYPQKALPGSKASGSSADTSPSPPHTAPLPLSPPLDTRSPKASAAAALTVRAALGLRSRAQMGARSSILMPEQPPPAIRPRQGVQQHMLSLKIICGAGTVYVYHCGGYEEDSRNEKGAVPRWEFFVGDAANVPAKDEQGRRQPIAQIASIEDHASAGDVIVSTELLSVIESESTSEPLDDGAARLLSMAAPMAPEPAAAPTGKLPVQVATRATALLRMHVVDNVRQRIEAGHYEFINEIRPLTVLFIGFPSLKDPDAAVANQVHQVQGAVTVVQQVMWRFQGSFVQFRCDEKGFLAICAFGLPGFSHPDNPQRGILAALNMAHIMASRGDKFACGVTTGDLLCACVGSKVRSEYTMFGDAINLSARLMCKAKAGLGTVLCDQTTSKAARLKAQFTELLPMAVKGKAQFIKAFSVEALEGADFSAMISQFAGRKLSSTVNKRMVGREGVLRQIRALATRLTDENMGSVLILEGPPGSGKTCMLNHLIEREEFDGRRGRINIFRASANAAFKSHSLYPWRGIIMGMFNAIRARDEEEKAYLNRTTRIAPSLASDPRYTDYERHVNMYVRDWHFWRTVLIEDLGLPAELVPAVIAADSSSQLRESVIADLKNFAVPDAASALAVAPSSSSLTNMRRVSLSRRNSVASIAATAARPSVDSRVPSSTSNSVSDFTLAGRRDGYAWQDAAADGPAAAGPSLLAAAPPGGDGDEARGSVTLTAVTPLSPLLTVDSFNERSPRVAGAPLGESTAGEHTLHGWQRADSSGDDLSGASHSSRRPSAAADLLLEPAGASDEDDAVQFRPPGVLPRGRHRSLVTFDEHGPPDLSGARSLAGPSVAPTMSGLSSIVSIESHEGLGLRKYAKGKPKRAALKSTSILATPRASAVVFGDGLPGGPPADGGERAGQTLMRSAGILRGADAFHDALSFSSLHNGRHKSDMSPELRRTRLQELIIQLMEIYIDTHGPVMLLLDDLHHFDTYSWQLLSLMASEVFTGLAIVASLRPNDGSLALESRSVEGKTQIFNKIVQCLESLVSMPNVKFVGLGPFEPREVRAMMEMLLPGWTIHESNVGVIHERCKGQPVYVEQMAYFLESHMQMAWTGLSLPYGVNELLEGGDGVVSMGDVIRSRLDKLRPAQQLTLKVCSVLGFFVSLELLEGAYPLPVDRASELPTTLLADLGVLVENNFLVPEPGIANMWRFANQVTQEVVYQVIPHFQRRLLHCKLARALQELARATPMKYPTTVIGYHWEQSCKGYEIPEWRRALTAIGCWKDAAELASAKGMSIEANRLFQKAVDIANTLYIALDTGQLVVTGDKDDSPPPSTLPGDDAAAGDAAAGDAHVGAIAATTALTDVVNNVALAFLHRRMAECYLTQFEHDGETFADGAVAAGGSGGNNGLLLDSCLRHCLLALIHLYVPMPGTHIPRTRSSAGCCFACVPLPFRPRVLSGRSSMLFRSSVLGRSRLDASGGASRLDPVEHVIDEMQATRVLRHDRQPAELQEIAVVFDVILHACRAQSSPDLGMMKYVREAGMFVLGDAVDREDSPIAVSVRKANAFLTRTFGGLAYSGTFVKRSKALEEVMRSGVSISHSAFSVSQSALQGGAAADSPVARRPTMQELARASSSHRNRILPF